MCVLSAIRSNWAAVMQHPNFETRHPLQTDEQQETGFDPLHNFNKNRSRMSALMIFKPWVWIRYSAARLRNTIVMPFFDRWTLVPFYVSYPSWVFQQFVEAVLQRSQGWLTSESQTWQTMPWDEHVFFWLWERNKILWPSRLWNLYSSFN